VQLGRWLIAFSGLTLAGYSACAFPDFQFDDVSSERSSGSGQTGVVTSGGGGAGVCSLGEIGACGEGQKCTVVDLETGQVGCALAGSRTLWDKCTTDADCADGSWCDLVLFACKPFCANVDSCVFGGMPGECIPLRKGDSTEVPGGAKHCTSGCEPIEPSICLAASGVSCVITEHGFDCAKHGGIPAFQACMSDPACMPGLVCGDDGVNKLCRPWCTPPGDNPNCPDFNNCLPTTPQVYWQAAEYGFCL
jgi:hypothetical protein